MIQKEDKVRSTIFSIPTRNNYRMQCFAWMVKNYICLSTASNRFNSLMSKMNKNVTIFIQAALFNGYYQTFYSSLTKMTTKTRKQQHVLSLILLIYP